jgi:Dolichyl-phosphate-mannose-protein mannosyltransferase
VLETSSTQRYEIRYVLRKQGAISAIQARWPLILILTAQVLVSVVTLHNTAFQDEALYIYAGRQIFNHWLGGPVPIDRYAVYFSGYPDFYPVIAGVLDMIGGLELARTFSLLCMMGVTICIYSITLGLFNRLSAIFAVATYVSLGSVLFVGRLATYDALCLLLLALAASLAYWASRSRKPWLVLIIGPLLILAVAAKYAALLFVLPVLGILVFYSLELQGWWSMMQRLVLVCCALLVCSVVAYLLMDKMVLEGLSLTTTNRVALIHRTPLQLLIRVLQLGGITYIAALLGLLLVFFRDKRYRLLALLLFASSWLVPAYHIYKQEYVSLDKHMAFSLFFAMPLIGYALTWLSGYTQSKSLKGRHWLAGLAVVLLVFTIGAQQAQEIYAGWADTTNLSYQLHTQLRAGGGRYLVEDIEVARYDSEDTSYDWQWNGVSYFYYTKSNGQHYLGNEALAQALKDRYFDIIELSFNYQPVQARFIAQQMVASKNYDLIAKVPFQNSFGTGYFYLWRKAAPGRGNFINW